MFRAGEEADAVYFIVAGEVPVSLIAPPDRKGSYRSCTDSVTLKRVDATFNLSTPAPVFKHLVASEAAALQCPNAVSAQIQPSTILKT